MFDTHCHLNFSRFKKNFAAVIKNAKTAGIIGIVVPGTDIPTSKKAIEIAEKNQGIYAAVGIHPHHVFELTLTAEVIFGELEKLISQPKVVAIGECGLDRHEYRNTKYEKYKVEENFVELQKIILEKQIDLAIKHKKSLILHNREAKTEMLPILEKKWNKHLDGRTVFHCCEADQELLGFAKKKGMFIGVDGDITYFKEKQDFIKAVPLEMLVLETDAPFLLPEPLRTQKKYPNEPKNLSLIAESVAKLKNVSFETIVAATTKNANRLFSV
ncbi:TatD family hydrolase [Candidatus Roizmanbacteria bacterium]|nr:TatD family hydrolase [Candidatus Roizmanbacteria bacterium]